MRESLTDENLKKLQIKTVTELYHLIVLSWSLLSFNLGTCHMACDFFFRSFFSSKAPIAVGILFSFFPCHFVPSQQTRDPALKGEHAELLEGLAGPVRAQGACPG